MTSVFRVEYFTHNQAIGSSGYVLLSSVQGSPYMWLKDIQKRTVRKGAISSQLATELKEGNNLILAGYKISVISSVSSEDDNAAQTGIQTIFTDENNSNKENFRGTCNTNESMRVVLKDNADEVAMLPKRKIMSVSHVKCPLVVDPHILLAMKTHQIEATDFVLNCLTRPLSDTSSPSTGAILADDVGTGKTLIGLAVMHTLTRHYTRKGIIICPSSLVLNWKREIKKWLPCNYFYSTIFIHGDAKSDDLVYNFITSSPESRPLLVISYDLFRSFAEALNTLTTLECMICDEGHRIKNAYGTKTTSALNNCIAMKRLLMTGTPIQNNLEELFSIVNFVCPFYLGTLKEFKTNYSSVLRSKDLDCQAAGAAADELRGKLSAVMLRRSKDSILRHSLPPRTDFIVHCKLSEDAAAAYASTAASVLSEEGSATTGLLPWLMDLRLLCNLNGRSAGEDSSREPKGKVKVVLELLAAMQSSCPRDKIVIVSSFTAVLDEVQQALKLKGVSCFRIDGSVAMDRRERIVRAFNDDGNPIPALLLSAKAGGAGLTLTGASRICLFEPDWNPATDAQALGRVWRHGQTRPVFVYRLVALGTIEETILQRQAQKNSLSSLIPLNDGDAKYIVTASKKPEADLDAGVLEAYSDGDLVKLVLPSGSDIEAIALGADVGMASRDSVLGLALGRIDSISVRIDESC